MLDRVPVLKLWLYYHIITTLFLKYLIFPPNNFIIKLLFHHFIKKNYITNDKVNNSHSPPRKSRSTLSLSFLLLCLLFKLKFIFSFFLFSVLLFKQMILPLFPFFKHLQWLLDKQLIFPMFFISFRKIHTRHQWHTFLADCFFSSVSSLALCSFLILSCFSLAFALRLSAFLSFQASYDATASPFFASSSFLFFRNMRRSMHLLVTSMYFFLSLQMVCCTVMLHLFLLFLEE